MRVYGPYYRPDGRQHVVIVNDDKSRRTVSYPKWIMEQHLGRQLNLDETVDHINRDFTDNRIENLRVVDRKTHATDDALRAQSIEITCIWCNKKALKRGNDLRGNEKQGKAGPFCSKSCSGKYGRQVQMGIIEPLGRVPTPETVYYYKEK